MLRHCPAMPSRSSASLIEVVSRRAARARDESSVTLAVDYSRRLDATCCGGSKVQDPPYISTPRFRTRPAGEPLLRRILLTRLDDTGHEAEADDDERTGDDPHLTDAGAMRPIRK